MQSVRKPTNKEKRIILFLISLSKIPIKIDIDKLRVKNLNDEGMGSLSLIPQNVKNVKREMGTITSEYVFEDKDGIKVIASLYLDKIGNLYELDMWKVDFSPVINLQIDNSIL